MPMHKQTYLTSANAQARGGMTSTGVPAPSAFPAVASCDLTRRCRPTTCCLSNPSASARDLPGSPSHVGPWPCSGHVGAADQVRCRRHRIASARLLFLYKKTSAGDCWRDLDAPARPLVRLHVSWFGCVHGCELPTIFWSCACVRLASLTPQPQLEAAY